MMRPDLPSISHRATRAARAGGFTLFEVLGAVALLSIVYTMLATAAIRGLRTEGESGRLLEASMIADWQLAEIDLQIDQGSIPELGIVESEQDGFRIRVEVLIFEIPELTTETSSLLAAQTSESVSTQPQSEPVFGEESPLREIRLVVAWGNPDDEQTVTRTTYGFDAGSIQLAGEAAVPGLPIPNDPQAPTP